MQKGFTLLELMTVIMIVGVISTLALPNYLSYLKRTRFLEVVHATMPYRSGVSSCIQLNGSADNCNQSESFIPPAITSTLGNIASLSVENGVISAKGTNTVDNAEYKLTPNIVDHNITWHVSGSCLKMGLCTK